MNKNPNANAAKATGQNKARRNAAANARRGITAIPKGDGMAMEVERQVRRTTIPSGVPGGKGGNNARRVTAPSAAAVRAKARALGGVASANVGGGAVGAITAPTQQAIGAAARAMKEHGFRVPKGMQMQISFVPKKPVTPAPTPPVFKTNNGGGAGRGGGGRGGGGRSGGRGGGRGGRGGRR
jgi:hypothetical protein